MKKLIKKIKIGGGSRADREDAAEAVKSMKSNTPRAVHTAPPTTVVSPQNTILKRLGIGLSKKKYTLTDLSDHHLLLICMYLPRDSIEALSFVSLKFNLLCSDIVERTLPIQYSVFVCALNIRPDIESARLAAESSRSSMVQTFGLLGSVLNFISSPSVESYSPHFFQNFSQLIATGSVTGDQKDVEISTKYLYSRFNLKSVVSGYTNVLKQQMEMDKHFLEDDFKRATLLFKYRLYSSENIPERAKYSCVVRLFDSSVESEHENDFKQYLSHLTNVISIDMNKNSKYTLPSLNDIVTNVDMSTPVIVPFCKLTTSIMRSKIADALFCRVLYNSEKEILWRMKESEVFALLEKYLQESNNIEETNIEEDAKRLHSLVNLTSIVEHFKTVNGTDEKLPLYVLRLHPKVKDALRWHRLSVNQKMAALKLGIVHAKSHRFGEYTIGVTDTPDDMLEAFPMINYNVNFPREYHPIEVELPKFTPKDKSHLGLYATVTLWKGFQVTKHIALYRYFVPLDIFHIDIDPEILCHFVPEKKTTGEWLTSIAKNLTSSVIHEVENTLHDIRVAAEEQIRQEIDEDENSEEFFDAE